MASWEAGFCAVVHGARRFTRVLTGVGLGVRAGAGLWHAFSVWLALPFRRCSLASATPSAPWTTSPRWWSRRTPMATRSRSRSSCSTPTRTPSTTPPRFPVWSAALSCPCVPTTAQLLVLGSCAIAGCARRANAPTTAGELTRIFLKRV